MAPVCTSCSSLSNVLPQEERVRRRAASLPMVQFCSEVSTYQHKVNKYFIIENPEASQIWSTEAFAKVAQMKGVQRATIHMCAYGLKDPASGIAMKKPMSLLHNIPSDIFAPLIQRCRTYHEH